jgi:hypothetical protein
VIFNPLRILSNVLAALSVLAAMVALPGGLYVSVQLDRLFHAKAYRPATFTVTWVAYRPSAPKSGADYWAVGTLDGGQRERYFLRDAVGGVHGWDDLEAQVAAGRQFKVLYDPSFAKTGDDWRLRLVPYEEGFAPRQRYRLVRAALLVYGTPLALLGLSVLTGVLSGTETFRAAPMTFFFLFGSVVGFVFIRVMSATMRAEHAGPGGSGGLDPLVDLINKVPWQLVGIAVLVGIAALRVVTWLMRGRR